MQRNYHSLMDHLGSGMEWDLHTRNDGLFILPPFLTKDNVGTYEGILDALLSNMGYLRRSKQEYLLLTNSHTALNTTFGDMLDFHAESGADMTLMYTKSKPGDNPVDRVQGRRHVYLHLNANGGVDDLEVGPQNPEGDNFYLDIMLLKRQLLIQLIDQAYAHGMHDFNRDLLQRYIRNNLLKVNSYQYKGYTRRIETVNSYYRFNMDLINRQIRGEFFSTNPVYTKKRDEVPAYYSPSAQVKNSLVADGCIIEGKVENSVLFRGVRVGKGASVKNSILMQEDSIQPNVELEYVIFDKNVTIQADERLIAPSQHPIVIGKNEVI
jgi:glucose-1-phosphate adenylyltransferase